MSSNIQVWEGMDLDVLDSQDKEVKNATSNEFWKPEVGENPIRFLPKLKGNKSHAKIVYEHFLDDVPGRDNTLRFVCPRNQTKGKQRCPVCEEADKLRKSRNPVDHERSKDLYPQMRIYTNILDRTAPENGPRVYPFGKTVWEFLKKIAKSKHNGGDYTNPGPNGFDIVVDRTGTGKNDTKYTVGADRNDSPLAVDAEQIAAWIEGQWNLDFYASVMEHEQLMALLRGERASGRGAVTGGRGGNGRTRGALPEGRRPARTAQDDVEDNGGQVIDVTPDEEEVPL